ncbi:MAG: formamidopyrimidine-DNA glycosylase [Acidobacteria bacterium]|nr:formamidopyrimidine-DNA glycosylase [Acidobacteriota bacterium]
MPELPDITAYMVALEPRIAGKRLEHVRLGTPFLLRTAIPPVTDAEGRTVRELRRIGKRIAIGLDGDLWLVLHLMIAGRLHWRTVGAKLAGKNMLAAFDFADGSLVLTEAGAKHRASLHVVSGCENLLAFDAGGIDVFVSDLAAFRAALTSENHTIKRALTDPRFLSGIGNAYSDEILHAAQLSPVLQTQKMTDHQWDRLFAATRRTLKLWMDQLSDEATKKFPEKVTAFRPEMAAHGKFGKPCPRCGDKIQRIRYADKETNYCAKCQNGGKLLADRSLSRLLGDDWPRTLEELETLKRK